MPTQDDVRRIALALPDVRNGAKLKDFAWVWQERIDPKQPRIPNAEVLAIGVAGADAREAILASNSEVYFTEPQYNGFPAVLVRLARIDLVELEELLVDGWACQAPKKLVRESGL